MTSEAGIIVERIGGVAVLRLNRPDRGNAIDLELAAQLADAVAEIEADEAVRCVLLTGTGRFFCVGGDVGNFAKAGAGVPLLLKKVTGHLHVAVSRLARMAKPLVVAVNGPAAGAGLGLAAIGDIVIASAEAHFTMAYTGIGLTPDGATTWLLPRLIGLRQTQDLALTNRRVPAREAASLGLITRVAEDTDPLPEALAIATQLAEGPTPAFGMVRQLLASSMESGIEVQMERESQFISAAAATAEGREGIIAFTQKRKPNFLSPS